MNKLTVEEVYSHFHNCGPNSSLWVPTYIRNAIIEREGFSSKPKIVIAGRVYDWNFKNIQGGMWELSVKELT